MKVNRKRSGGHHLPCLSGLSHSPLIADNGSERSTQITAHSLTLRSPTIITSHQQQHSQPQQAVPISSTPQLPHSSASISLPGVNIFFPPLPPRSASKLMFETNNMATTNGRVATNSTDVNLPPRDINMNVDNERNRESGHHQHILSPINHQVSPGHVRHPGSNSSGVNSPLSVPADTFSGFFPESQQTFAQQQLQLQQQSRRSIANQPPTPSSISITRLPINSSNSSNNNSNGNNIKHINNWPQQIQQDENYHLYHEPMDPDEQVDPAQRSQSSSKNEPQNTPMITPSIKFDSLNLVPPPPRPRSNLSTTGPTERSPSFNHQTNQMSANQNNTTPSQVPTSTSSFTDRVGGHKDDVSEDIYHRYVTLKSNERSNHRSRSYHGPKNTTTTTTASNNHNAQNSLQSALVNAPKNLSSNSVAELQMSPTVPGRRLMPIQFRDHCVRELIETESNYVHALEMIIVGFADRIKILLDKEQDKLIFGQIRNFHHIHSVFQAHLVKAAFRIYNKDLPKLPSPKRNSTTSTSKPSTPTLTGAKDLINISPLSSPKDLLANSPQTALTNKTTTNGDNNLKISTCFLNIKEKFLKYGEYCATLSKAQALLDELTSKNETIAAQLDRCQQEANEGKFKLRDLLSLPMQRILKYHLLLAQLIKNTNPTNEDYQGLKRAHEAMVDLGQYINEVKRDSEAIQIINDIENSIVGLNMPSNTQLTDYGRLVTDGFLRVKVPQDPKPKVSQESRLKLPHDTKVKQKRYVFVFDKVMLITLCKTSRYQYKEKSGASTYYYKEALVFSEYELDINPKNPSTETLGKHATRDKWSFNFNLIRISDRSVYSFYLKTQEMKNKWISAIQKAMDNTRPASCRQSATNHEFLMHTFDKASSCDHCGKLLLGLLYQGYRCRICFTSVHKKCLTAIRPCGPALPPKNTSTLSYSQNRGRNNEPESPSIRSNCSDNENAFANFPVSNSSSIQCMEALMKNEYTNVARNQDSLASPLSSFREKNNGKTASQRLNSMANQRPVSSMINVSSQNSTNQLLQQKRLLGGSASTPVMNRDTCLRAKVISDYDGDEQTGELKIQVGQLIIVDLSKRTMIDLEDELDGSFSQLDLRKMWFGRNIDTNKEGRFPADNVELISGQTQNDTDCLKHSNGHGSANLHVDNENINFLLKDKPWFLGRADRDQARDLLKNMPNETFLVRASLRRNGSYAIDLKHDNEVKHMRVYVSQDGAQLYLSEARYFKSLLDLVSWYEQNSLEECFASLNARLRIPYKNCQKMVDHSAQDLL